MILKDIIVNKQNIQKASNNRIKWLDIAKGIAIICTILGHTVAFKSNIRNIIFSFHMPLFFILSGYTIKNISINEFEKNTIISILITIMASWCVINFSNVLIFIGKYSLELLCIHFFDIYYSRLWNISNMMILNSIIRCLIDIAILYIFEYIKKLILNHKN